LFALGILVAGCGGSKPAPVSAPVVHVPDPLRASNELAPPSAFAAIVDPSARSRALFAEAARVFTNPRCTNCHPQDDSPRQGDSHRMHDPPAIRGLHDRGALAMECTTCHQEQNSTMYRVPGAPDWHLAPKAMAWLDRTPAQICAELKDPARNGGRSLAKVVEHVAHDKLVAWGWAPGADRTPAPGSAAELAALVQAWADTGAACPDESR
jgi:hypothetical protein